MTNRVRVNEPILMDKYGNSVEHLLHPHGAAPAQLFVTKTASGEIVPVVVVDVLSPWQPLTGQAQVALLSA